MLGQMKSMRIWHVISILVWLPLLLLIVSCSSKNMGVAGAADGRDSATCSQTLDNLEAKLAESQSCKQDSDCQAFEISPLGCWRLYSKKNKDELEKMMKPLQGEGCRFFLPTYKCGAKPGEIACEVGRCRWLVTAGD